MLVVLEAMKSKTIALTRMQGQGLDVQLQLLGKTGKHRLDVEKGGLFTSCSHDY